MSDFSGMDQSFGLMPATAGAGYFEPPPPLAEVQPHEVDFRRLKGHSEIARILHLRNELQLPSSALRDPGFAAREKKETRSAWWGHFCGAARP